MSRIGLTEVAYFLPSLIIKMIQTSEEMESAHLEVRVLQQPFLKKKSVLLFMFLKVLIKYLFYLDFYFLLSIVFIV